MYIYEYIYIANPKIQISRVISNIVCVERLYVFHQENKCYPKGNQIIKKLLLTAALCNEIWPQ